jgi:ubiquinone/menaquinone biosynthesis C-methylase UbiE
MTPIDRWIHARRQEGRTAWYLAHAFLASRLSSPILENMPAGLPDRQTYIQELLSFLERDRHHVETGRYVLPNESVPRPTNLLRATTRFLGDLSLINLRRMRGDGSEVYRRQAKGPKRIRRPRYYLQNFHYQTDGWMSDISADLYDFQVDVLFGGATDAMRRQALLPIGDFLRGRRQADLQLLDVAAGTGRFLRSVKQNFPRLPIAGLDLSPTYLAKAKGTLGDWSWVSLVLANAEDLPFSEGSQDLVTSVYLLHELPKKARKRVAAEMARVLKPGGRLVLVDSLQTGDYPPFDGLLELFPMLYHEPYYHDYVGTNLRGLFEDEGLYHLQTDRAFMSKIMVFTKKH